MASCTSTIGVTIQSKPDRKFEKQYNVKVTLDDYDSNETMLSKVRAGNSAMTSWCHRTTP